ncbi:hypothetical protein SISSUDRAFT_1038676, partial [Sistotremastrum suecicum HHB10207 ss-3]
DDDPVELYKRTSILYSDASYGLTNSMLPSDAVDMLVIVAFRKRLCLLKDNLMSALRSGTSGFSDLRLLTSMTYTSESRTSEPDLNVALNEDALLRDIKDSMIYVTVLRSLHISVSLPLFAVLLLFDPMVSRDLGNLGVITLT